MAEADEALRYALTMFPSALLPLLDKCSIEADPRAATSSFFLEGHSSKVKKKAWTLFALCISPQRGMNFDPTFTGSFILSPRDSKDTI